MKDNLECHLEDPNSNELLEKEIIRLRKLRIILFFIIIFLVIVVIVFIILYFAKAKKEDSKDNHSKGDSPDKPDEEYPEEYPEYSLYCNITTAENKTIKNSFKKGAENYIEEFGNVNNGKDYEETDRDNFDLSIPYTAAKKKTIRQ